MERVSEDSINERKNGNSYSGRMSRISLCLSVSFFFGFFSSFVPLRYSITNHHLAKHQLPYNADVVLLNTPGSSNVQLGHGSIHRID